MTSLRTPISLLVIFAGLFIQSSCHDHNCLLPEKHVALFMFGDSIFDNGNNNYINTTADAQANFWPYGETFFKYPNGRFCDGRLISDFFAEYAKLPLIPPYLHPAYFEHTNGVNFASGGTGALVETLQGLVIDLKTQLSYFKDVKNELRKKLGDAEAKKLVSRAVYFFSVGSGDYISYFFNSTGQQSYSQKEYTGMVIGNMTSAIKEIYNMGGRKFWFPNLAPLGCFPFMKAVLPPAGSTGCVEGITPILKLHNRVFPQVLKQLETQLKGFRYSFFEFYNLLTDSINNPSKYGFKDGTMACCGTGPYRGIPSCGGRRTVKEYELCDNPSDFLFFDASHVTERAQQLYAELMWNGPPNVTGPYNLKALIEEY